MRKFAAVVVACGLVLASALTCRAEMLCLYDHQTDGFSVLDLAVKTQLVGHGTVSAIIYPSGSDDPILASGTAFQVDPTKLKVALTLMRAELDTNIDSVIWNLYIDQATNEVTGRYRTFPDDYSGEIAPGMFEIVSCQDGTPQQREGVRAAAANKRACSPHLGCRQ